MISQLIVKKSNIFDNVDVIKQVFEWWNSKIFRSLDSKLWTVQHKMLNSKCDNLALNGLLGFTESFSADYFCTMCYATQDDIKSKFYESEFRLQTESGYQEDLALIASGRQAVLCIHMVWKDCILNEIPYFHVTHNFSLDIMRIVLEGIVQVELSCVLHHLCILKRYLTYDDLSAKIASFWSAVDVEKCNKPPDLNRIDKPLSINESCTILDTAEISSTHYWT